MTEAEKDRAKEIARRWAGHVVIGPHTDPISIVSQAYLSLLADQEGRGEVVEVCPHCSAHEPEWLPDAGCWRCHNCCVHLDAVERWQFLGTIPRGSCSCWIGRGGWGGPSEQRIACAVHGDHVKAPVEGPS